MNIFILKTIKIRSYEMGLYFRDGEFRGLLREGRHWFVDPLGKVKVEVVSQRQPWLAHEKLDVISRSGALKDRAVVLDLKDYERALVWIDGRFSHILPPGLYAYWTALRDVKVEVVDARRVRFEHPDLKVIVQSPSVERVLELATVQAHHVGVLFIDGKYVETLSSGRYAFWKGEGRVEVRRVELREQMVDIVGQDIMTSDKATLRLPSGEMRYVHLDCRATVGQVSNIEHSRVSVGKAGRSRLYNGLWRDRDPKHAPPGVKPVIRLKVPLEGETVIEDRVQGRVVWQNADLDDMIILRGVNVFPTQIEEALLATDWCGGHFVIELTREGRMDEMTVLAEARPERWDGSGLVEQAGALAHHIKSTIGISTRIRIVAPDTLERSLGKAKRVYDKRPKG